MFPLILSINLVNLVNLTVVGGLFYYVYKKNVVSYDSYDNLTFLKPKNHLLPVNVEKYKDDRLEYIQSIIKEYNDLYNTSLLLVEEDSDEEEEDDDESNVEKVVVEDESNVEKVVVEDESNIVDDEVVVEDESNIVDDEVVKKED